MCNSVIIKEKNRGNVHYSVLLLMFFLIVLLSFVFLEIRIVINQKDQVDNSLVISAFSASVCDCVAMAEVMEPIKIKQNDEVVYDFEQMYQNTGIIVQTEDIRIMEEAVTTLIIYNVGEDLEIYKLENGHESRKIIKDYGENNRITSPNGVPILKTSVYVKADFTVCGILSRKKNVFLEKCIVLQFANE